MATTLNVIKTITIRGTAEGVAEVERQLTSLAGTMEEVTVASGQQEKAYLSTEQALRKLQSRYDQEFRAQQSLAQVQKTLSQAQAQGLVSQQRASELMQQAIVFHNKSATAVNDNAKSNDNLASSTKASRFELLNLSRQLQDVVVGAASGQRAFTILVQQGSQIVDVFQSASLSGRSLGREILGLITPMRLFAGGIVLAVGAAAFLANSWKNVEMQFLNLSDRLNIPIQKLHELEAAAAIKGVNLDEFVSAMEQFGDATNLAKRGLGDLYELLRLNGIQSKGLEQNLM